MRYRVGIDIGGTFSDLVVMDEDGRVSTLKVSSASDAVIAGLVDGLRDLQQQAGLAPADAIAVVHGTTAATNAILEYRGARTGLITTKGFRDILEIRRLRVGRLYDLGWDKPKPLVPRRLRREVPERLDVHGEVVESLDLTEAERVVDRLLADEPEAIAVVLMHAYANGDHERQIGELIASKAPGVFLSMSHDVLPEIGEYERTSTTVVNAYVGPIADRYLGQLEAGLASGGVEAPLLMMQSNGGVIRASTARRRPVQVVESGPAGGVIAAVRLSQQCDVPNLITVDMGGTTAKASILEDGQPFQVAEYEVGAGISVGSRMFKGGGHTLRVPALDIAEVGAGGGSLIRVDTGGGLRVGPESAGATPGPVCYGLGNEQPTLTDANLVLGYLNQTHLLGGSLPIDGAASHRAVRKQVADPLGLDLLSAAYGAHQIAVSNMVRVARAVSTERGRDPRRCTLVAFGGNGPVHAAEVARQLGIGEVIVPPWPGLFSAFGLLAAETRLEVSQANRQLLADRTPADLLAGFVELERSARATLHEEGHTDAVIEIDRLLDLRYRGQSSDLRIPAPGLENLVDVATIAAAFEDEHQRTYGYRDGPERVEIVSYRLVARVAVQLPTAQVSPMSSTVPATRTAYFGQEYGALQTQILGRGDLDSSPRTGPLIVEEYDATTIVPPGWSVRLDQHANIRLAADV